jgi:hypothetical protein
MVRRPFMGVHCCNSGLADFGEKTTAAGSGHHWKKTVKSVVRA